MTLRPSIIPPIPRQGPFQIAGADQRQFTLGQPGVVQTLQHGPHGETPIPGAADETRCAKLTP